MPRQRKTIPERAEFSSRPNRNRTASRPAHRSHEPAVPAIALGTATTRQPIGEERRSLQADGRVNRTLDQSFKDGSTQVLLERRCEMVPRPRPALQSYPCALTRTVGLRARGVPPSPLRRTTFVAAIVSGAERHAEDVV